MANLRDTLMEYYGDKIIQWNAVEITASAVLYLVETLDTYDITMVKRCESTKKLVAERMGFWCKDGRHRGNSDFEMLVELTIKLERIKRDMEKTRKPLYWKSNTMYGGGSLVSIYVDDEGGQHTIYFDEKSGKIQGRMHLAQGNYRKFEVDEHPF